MDAPGDDVSGVVASIGTTHPWNVAGVGLDLLVAREFSVRALTVVAAVSAQDERGLHALEAVSAELLDAQLTALPMSEVGALRVGALCGARTVRRIAEFLAAHANVPAVVDPVFGATHGGAFLDDAAFTALCDSVATLPSVVLTPNAPEAARLLGTPVTRASQTDAAQILRARGARAVLLKGGHFDGEPVDVLADETGVQTYTDTRLAAEMRGTGCALAMAIACELASGNGLREAVVTARAFVRTTIENAHPFHGLSAAY